MGDFVPAGGKQQKGVDYSRSQSSLNGACPSAGALLKAAFICAGIVDVHSKLSLSEQLLRTFGGGFELHTWSELPHGSGLGE